MLKPEELVGKRIAWGSGQKTMHGEVAATAGNPEIIYVHVGRRGSKEVCKVNVRDILKVY